MSVNRDKPLETVRPIRNQLCDLLHVKRPVLLSVCSKVFISIIQLVVYLTAFSSVSGCAHIVIWSFVRAVHWWMHQTITQRTWVQFPVVRVWVIGASGRASPAPESSTSKEWIYDVKRPSEALSCRPSFIKTWTCPCMELDFLVHRSSFGQMPFLAPSVKRLTVRIESNFCGCK